MYFILRVKKKKKKYCEIQKKLVPYEISYMQYKQLGFKYPLVILFRRMDYTNCGGGGGGG